MSDLKIYAHGYTEETWALAELLCGYSLRVDGEGLRARLRSMLDAAEKDPTYSDERFDRTSGMAQFLADMLRQASRLAEERRKAGYPA